METRDKQLPKFLDKLRWFIPILLVVFSVGYVLFDHLWLTSVPITSAHVLRETFIIGTVGPTLAWLLLTWATRIAHSRQETRTMLKRRALQLEAASQVSQKVTAILEVDELLSQVVNLIRDKFGYYHVHIFLVDGHSNEIVLREGTGKAGQILKAQGLRLEIGEQSITGRVAQSGQPILCNNVVKETGFHPHELLPNTQSELAVPFRIGDVIVGVLDVQSEKLNAFQEDDVTTLQILGDQIAIAIENANLFRETQHRFEIMRGLHDISLEITSRLNRDRVIKVVLDQATQLLNAQGGSISVYNPETNLIHKLVHSNAEYQAVVLQVGEGAAGRVVATGKPVIINDLKHWAGRASVFKDSPYNAILSVPLFWQGEVFGSLNVMNPNDDRPFNEDDVKLLSLFADLASIAIKNAELYTQVVESNQQLEEMVEKRTNDLVIAREEVAQKADQLQRLLADMVRLQEEERARIALDLHDGSNQLITGALFEIQAAQQNILGQRAASALETLETAKKLLRQIEAENRRIISGLRPPVLDTQGLVSTLKWYISKWEEYYGITCSLEVLGQPIRLSPETEIAIYRVVQEALNNVVMHAHAETVQICVIFNSTLLQIAIQDDGIGFDNETAVASASNHFGLIGMRERIQSIGGQIEIQSVTERGTRISFDVPVSTEPISV